MTLGQRISRYRKELGISQEALGERLGVSRQAVSKWETDAAAPDMTNLMALAREFGVSVAELTETPEPRESPAAPSLRRGWWVMLGIFEAVTLVLLGVVIDWCVHADDGQVSKTPSRFPISDFALVWTSIDGHEEFLELG